MQAISTKQVIDAQVAVHAKHQQEQRRAQQQQIDNQTTFDHQHQSHAIGKQGNQREQRIQIITQIQTGVVSEDGVDGDEEGDDPGQEAEAEVAVQQEPTQAEVDAIFDEIFNEDPQFACEKVELKRRRTDESEEHTAAGTTEVGDGCASEPETMKFSDGEIFDVAVEEQIVRPEVTIPRKRDVKASQKRIGVKQACEGCHIGFWKLQHVQGHMICHNCVKIVQAIQATADFQQGTCQIVRAQAQKIVIEVQCQRGHVWTTQFKAKQGQRWCRACSRDEIQRRKQQVAAQEAAERERIAQEQEQMFRQAREEFQHIEEAPEPVPQQDPGVVFIQQVVHAIVEPGPQAIDIDDQQVQHRFVDVIMAIGAQGQEVIDQVIEQIFDAIAERQQIERVIRRIKFMVHPDKNAHMKAKDAFQILSNSCWRRKKYNKSKKSSFSTTTTTFTPFTTTTTKTIPMHRTQIDTIFAQWHSWCLLRATQYILVILAITLSNQLETEGQQSMVPSPPVMIEVLG